MEVRQKLQEEDWSQGQEEEHTREPPRPAQGRDPGVRQRQTNVQCEEAGGTRGQVAGGTRPGEREAQMLPRDKCDLEPSTTDYNKAMNYNLGEKWLQEGSGGRVTSKKEDKGQFRG